MCTAAVPAPGSNPVSDSWYRSVVRTTSGNPKLLLRETKPKFWREALGFENRAILRDVNFEFLYDLFLVVP